MSLQVELEADDHKFIQQTKSWWVEAKRQAVWLIVALTVGFGLGKLYTWDTIISDCKVIGAFRIANTAFHCKMMVP